MFTLLQFYILSCCVLFFILLTPVIRLYGNSGHSLVVLTTWLVCPGPGEDFVEDPLMEQNLEYFQALAEQQ
jgi:hypothetical protein